MSPKELSTKEAQGEVEIYLWDGQWQILMCVLP